VGVWVCGESKNGCEELTVFYECNRLGGVHSKTHTHSRTVEKRPGLSRKGPEMRPSLRGYAPRTARRVQVPKRPRARRPRSDARLPEAMSRKMSARTPCWHRFPPPPPRPPVPRKTDWDGLLWRSTLVLHFWALQGLSALCNVAG
jgi:hypothetical protein